MLKNVGKIEPKVKGEEKILIVQCEGKQILIKNDRYYTRKHMWAKKSSEGNFKVGVTDYAQKFLREKVALIEITKNPTVGNEVEAGEVFGVMYGRLYANLDLMRCEYVSFNLTSPIDGRIVKVNSAVMDNPQLINSDPYEKGWIAMITPSPKSDLSDLITPLKYKKMLEEREESPFKVI